MIHSLFSGMNLHQLPIQIFFYIVSETLESYTSTLAENSAVTVTQCQNVCWVQMGYLIIMMLFPTWPSSAHSVYCAYRSHTLLTTAEQVIYTATVQTVHHSSVSGSAAVKEFLM